jgi:Tfp pilus assembly protein PilF
MATQEEMAEWLYDGAIALRQGNKERALELLMQVVEADEENEAAWLWLSGAVDELEDQQIALENVLAINPNNTAAQQGLELVMQQKQQRDAG